MLAVYTIGAEETPLVGNATPTKRRYSAKLVEPEPDAFLLSDDALEDEPKRPRVVGPPLKRPRPVGNRGSGAKGPLTLGSGEGRCPPGNAPTRDESTGKLVLCNGLNPNCPPRSYCFVTTGGFATEQYNCCKSW